MRLPEKQFIKVLLVIVLSGLACPIYSQGQTLKEMISSANDAKDDSSKINLLLSICDSLYRSKPSESLQFALKARELAEKLKYIKGEAYACKYIGMGYYVQGEYVKAIESFENALEIFEAINSKKGIANILNSLGVIYNNYGNDSKALELFLQSLKISEDINDSVRIVSALTNIGLIYSKKDITVKNAKEYYLKALIIAKDIDYTLGIGTLTANLGELLYSEGEYREALAYFDSSLKAYEKINSWNVSYSLNYIGKIYTKWEDYDNAIKYQEKALANARETNSKLEIGQSMLGLANTYLQKGDYQKALSYFKQSEKITGEIGANYERREIYEGMAQAYSRRGDYLNAYNTQLKASALKDTIYSQTSRDAINKVQLQLEFASMIKENTLLKSEARLKDSKNKLQMAAIGLLILGFISISVFLALLARANNHKKKANVKLNRTNEELNATLGIVNLQKKQIETAHGEITASINYARYIQSSVLPKAELLESCLGEHFILHKPVEIVSGDFYWAAEKDHKTIIVAADCTGHGVPGAFMSMLGITLLNEIVNKESVTHPADILNHLRKEVTDSLKQKGDRWEQKDGMDIALCTIDRKNMKLQFAGAINPLYIIRETCPENTGLVNEASTGRERLIEIKGDSMPIGIVDDMESFSCHEIDICTGDRFYLFSDGFPDQFGGPDHKRFTYKRFSEHLVRTKTDSMANQKLKLEKVLNEWIGTNNQTDDILVIGFRIN